MKTRTVGTWSAVGCAILALSSPAAHAAVLTTVPMQGGMVMPMVSYNATTGSLQVDVDPAVPALTPLLVSNPADRFDPADPWFDALDPRRRGLAFSRRYGFVMNSVTDPLPDGTAIFIRKLSGSPGLGAYRYRSSAPKAFEPVFGTSGSSDTLMWNGMMFHPCFTVLPGTNTFSATFDAFLADTNTSQAVPGSSSGPFVLNWTDLPDGRPVLKIAEKIVVAWPATATNHVLEAADSLTAAEWTPVTNAPVLVEGDTVVILDCRGTQKFFRMSPVQ